MATEYAFWERKWGEDFAPGKFWDLGEPHKALAELLDSDRFDVNDKRIVIPGCGRGYDAILLAERGGQVEGLELVDRAVTEARAYLEEYNTKNHSNVKVTYTTVDFFEHKGVYDGGYDYTFLCALPPDARHKWAEKWTELIVSGGVLLTLVFPIYPGKVDGPPWHIDQSIVTELLHKNFDLVLEEKVPDAWSKPNRAGREVVMLWKKK